METKQKARPENVVAGVVGAFLGSLLGVVCTVVIGQLGYVASISGLIMAVGALKGYELLAGRLSKKGALISSVLIVVMTWLAHRLGWAIAVASELDMGIFDCFKVIPSMVKTGMLESTAYWGDLAMLYLFTLLGAVPTIIGGLRSTSMPDLPQGTAASVFQNGDAPEAVFYPGSIPWMRPLRLCSSLSILLGLVPAMILLFASAAGGITFTPLLAAVGCLISSVIMMCIALPTIQLCNNAMPLMVRAGSTIWKVNLSALNAADTYRFTKKNGAIRVLRWDILTPEEQAQAKASIQRAIALLSSGQVMPGSALSLAVLPLTNLRVVKENHWTWTCVYSVANGKEKKVLIPKAYQGFAPAPGLETAQEPVPARWGLLGLAVVLAVLLGAAGAGVGYVIDSGGYRSNSPDPAPVFTPSAQPTPTPMPTPDPRDLFHVAEELGYEYTAVGYIKAPQGMYGAEAPYVDAHVPYSEAPEYLEDGYAIRSSAHGMEVTVKVVQSDGNAENVVNLAYELLVSAGADLYDEAVYDTYYFDEYDVAVKQIAYFEEDRTKVRVAVLYADYKDDGFYLSSCLVYQPELLDDEYPALLAELSDAYALNLPEIEPMDPA